MNPVHHLMLKGQEFYMCAMHMNPRGVRDVVEEARPIVDSLKASGKTFEEVVDEMSELAGCRPNLETDKFLEHVRAMFEAKP
jgi:hypothetical protein